jgi:phage-related protein
MSKTISIDVVADVQRAVVGLEAVNNRLDRLDKQSDKTGRGFGSFVEHVRDLAVAQVAVNALSKGFPDLSFGVDAVARKATLLAGAFTAAAAAGAPVLALAGGLSTAFGAAGAGVGAFVALVKPAFSAVATGVQGASAAQDAYNAALAAGDPKAAQAALEARSAALAVLTPAQRTAAEATLSLKDALKAQSDAFALPVLFAYTRGIETVKTLLPDLVALATPARDALIAIFDRANEAARSPEFHAFVQFLAAQVGPTIAKLGDIAFSFGGVLKNVFVAAAPVAQTALDIFVELARTLNQASAGSGLIQFFQQMQPLMASVGDLVATIVKAFGSLVQAALPLAGPVLNAVSALGAALGKLFQSNDFATFVQNLGSIFKQLVPVFDQLAQVVGKVFSALSGQLAQVLPDLIPVIEDFAKVFGDVLVGLSPLLGPIAKLVDALVKDLLPVIGQLVPVIKQALVPVIDSLAQIVPQLAPSFVQVVQAITPLLPQIVQLVQAVLPLVPGIVQLAAALIDLAVKALVPLMPYIIQFVQMLVQQLIPAIQTNAQNVQWLADKFTEFSQSPVFKTLADAVSFNLTIILGVLTAVSQALTGDWKGAWETAKQTVIDAVGIIKQSVHDNFDAVNEKVRGAMVDLRQRVDDAFNAMVNAVTQRVGQVVSAVQQIPDKIKGALADAGEYLKDAGKKIIDGLVKGIQDSSPLVKGALGAITASIPQWKGPPSTDAKLLYDAGQLIMKGLVDGLDKGETGVMKQLQGTSQRIANAFDGTSATLTTSLSGFGSNVSVAGAGGGGGGNVYQITVEASPTSDLVSIGRACVEAIDAYETVGGRR